jgi:uncharacterized membrane protein YphA (DoxX/SURF4 family)
MPHRRLRRCSMAAAAATGSGISVTDGLHLDVCGGGMNDKVLAYTALRLLMGLNIFMHGAVRVGTSYTAFVQATQAQFAETWLPTWLVGLEARAIPGVEIAVGALILLGYKTRWAVLGGMALLATLLFGMVVLQNWEIVSRHLIYALVFYVLLHNSEFNRFSLDRRGGQSTS